MPVLLFLAAACGPIVPSAAVRAEGKPFGTITIADPERQSDGIMSEAAAAGLSHGPLPISAAVVEFQADLNRRLQEEMETWTQRRRSAPEIDIAARSSAVRKPISADDIIREGPRDRRYTPPNNTLASIGLKWAAAADREYYLQGYFDVPPYTKRSLQSLAGVHRSVPVYDPQVIWDAQTNRIYYAAVVDVAADDHAIAFGFSKTASPGNSSNFCHYLYSYANRLPNDLHLGDNKDFIIIGVNAFQPSFSGTDITAIRKPPPGPGCPAVGSFKKGTAFSVRDTDGVLVASAVPANQIDDLAVGYVAATVATPIPGNKIWVFDVRKAEPSGFPLFSPARGITVANYFPSPVATQPGSTRRLRTGDARLGQAVQARNPKRPAGVFSLWTQHTVGHPTQSRSVVRWYEIDPGPAVPVVLRTDAIGLDSALDGNFYFNGAISPDRVRKGSTKKFGNSFVIYYNVSSSVNGINPRIDAASSVNGGPLTSSILKKGVGPYQDFSCPNPFDLCQWGGAAASPDPNPDPDRPRPTRGVVWGINQYSGVVDPPTAPGDAQWRTRIFTVQP